MKIIDRDLEAVTQLVVDRIEIVIDDARPDKVELYHVDSQGDRIEGGTFDRSQFMDHILAFYNANF